MDSPTTSERDADELLRDADRARDSEDWTLAEMLYGAFLELRPEAWGIRVQKGHCRKERGDPAGALALYREAEETAPEDADLQLQIGHALKLMGRNDEAEAAYARAAGFDPGFAAARQELIAIRRQIALSLALSSPVDTQAPRISVSTEHPSVVSPIRAAPEDSINELEDTGFIENSKKQTPQQIKSVGLQDHVAATKARELVSNLLIHFQSDGLVEAFIYELSNVLFRNKTLEKSWTDWCMDFLTAPHIAEFEVSGDVLAGDRELAEVGPYQFSTYPYFDQVEFLEEIMYGLSITFSTEVPGRGYEQQILKASFVRLLAKAEPENTTKGTTIQDIADLRMVARSLSLDLFALQDHLKSFMLSFSTKIGNDDQETPNAT